LLCKYLFKNSYIYIYIYIYVGQSLYTKQEQQIFKMKRQRLTEISSEDKNNGRKSFRYKFRNKWPGTLCKFIQIDITKYNLVYIVTSVYINDV